MGTRATELINELPAQRKKDIKILRKVLKANIPKEVKESVDGDQLVYTLPKRYFPETYTKKALLYGTLSNRKGYISLNLISIFNDKKYRHTFAKKLLKTGACIGASGCCYKIKTVNPELLDLLEKEITKMDRKKFVDTFIKYRQN